MKFKALPVTSLEDATLDFEQLQTLDILNLTAESVLQLAVTGTKRKVAFGQTTCVGGSSVAVPHGLGVVPVAFAAISGRSGAGIVPAIVDANQDPTNTTLTLAATQTTGSGNTYKIWWFAIA
jgi:hypothetical protein